MNDHLSEDQISEWLLGAREEIARRHLEVCGVCSLEAEKLHRAIAGFRDSVHAAARRDRSFWRVQQLAIRGQASARNWYPVHWAWAAAMVLVLIAAIFLERPPGFRPVNSGDDADRALLQEVQGDIGRDVPQALAPAVLIAQERNEILSSEVTKQATTTLKKRR